MSGNAEDVAAANGKLYSERLPARHIRLFRIGQPCGHCLFETHSLDDPPEYFCLSYTWGASENRYDPNVNLANRDGVPIYLNPLDKDFGQPYPDHEAHDDVEVGEALYLEVEGEQYRVSKNVHDVVSRAIRSGFEGLFWIDALCINQADALEKAEQVFMMSSIFEKALAVHVWLGEDKRGEAEVVVRLCQTIQTVFREYRLDDDGSFDRNSQLKKMPNLFADLEALERLGLPSVLAEEWEIFARFWDRRWFNRVWIVQEVSLPRDYSFFWWGDHQLDARMLTDVSQFITQSELWLAGRRARNTLRPKPSETFPALGGNGRPEWTVLQRRIGETLGKVRALKAIIFEAPEANVMADQFLWRCDALAGPASSSRRESRDLMRLWAHMLALFCSFDAENPRDFVYATVGIIQAIAKRFQIDMPQIQVDYTKTVAEVFADATICMLEATGRLSLICTAQDPQMRKQVNLPSWVPDFSARSETAILLGRLARWKTMPELYALSKDPIELASPFFEVQRSLRVLRVMALPLDKVSAIGESWQEIVNGGLCERTVQMLFDSQRYEEPYAETLWRLLVANSSCEGLGIASQDMAADFKAFVTVSIIMAMLFNPNHLNSVPKFGRLVEIDTARGDAAILPTFEELREYFALVVDRYRAIEAGGPIPKSTPVTARATVFMNAMEPMHHRRIFMTESGLLGIAPISTLPGDEVWVLPEAPLPVVLRRLDGGDPNHEEDAARYTLLGESYLHGDPGFEDGLHKWQWIQLH